MRLLRAVTVNDANLTSNIVEAGTYPEYASTATYALGTQVMDTAGASPTHYVYESLVDGNIGNALTDETKWVFVGSTNRYAMFDQSNGTATTSASGIDVTVNVAGRCDGLALLGLSAQNVTVTMTVGASTVYSSTIDLQSDSGITSWYDWFSEDIAYKTDLVIDDMPLYTGCSVRVQIGTGTVSCGTMVLGQTRDLGGTTYGARAGITDYSKKTVDEFGNYQIVPRSFSKRMTVKLYTDNSRIDELHSLLTEYRTTPAVWLGTETYACTWVFGFYKDFDVEIAQPQKSYISIEIEGLT